ncbi:WxcM-like domain-containing protein [Sediminibacterium sp.]|uniref:WxcM-like domain-containing protein n=1 Tax=Sediminibacterium sp. TaxID=1917865 RepID=UPI003F70BD35
MSQNPFIIEGNRATDGRGSICFNNNFNAVEVKRIYFIENRALDFIRGWQGHKIEKRWFLCVSGSFKINVIRLDSWENPSTDLKINIFHLNAENTSVLYVPNGHITSIQALEAGSKLMAMSDYLLGELKDEYRFEINYFN